VTEWSGWYFYPRKLDPVRVSLEPAVQLAKGGEFGFRKVASITHGCIEHGTSVAFGEQQPISLRPVRAYRIETQMMVKQSGKDFGNRECTP
jgi:hypothetical protein